MTDKTRELRIFAFENAAEFIRSHPEAGWTEEDYEQSGMSIEDEAAYLKACNHAYKVISKLADKLR